MLLKLILGSFGSSDTVDYPEVLTYHCLCTWVRMVTKHLCNDTMLTLSTGLTLHIHMIIENVLLFQMSLVLSTHSQESPVEVKT